MTDDCPMTGEEIAKILNWELKYVQLAVGDLFARIQDVTRAAYAKGRIAGLEEAAKVCDDYEDAAAGVYSRTYNPYDDGRADASECCADNIRALIAKEKEGQKT